MKSDPKVVEALNGLLMEELTAINQYILHSEMCSNWGYGKLAGVIKKAAIDEMKHAEKLIEHILLLDNKPTVSVLKPMHVGADAEKIITGNLKLEYGGRESYNAGIKVAVAAGDNGSRAIMESNLSDEEGHIDYLEGLKDQIEQMGLQQFLAQQLD
jgi:bacterioferritin